MIVEEVAKIGRNRDRITSLRASLARSARGAEVTPWSAGISRRALVRVASKLAGASILDESKRQVFVVVEVIQDLLVRVTERMISR